MNKESAMDLVFKIFKENREDLIKDFRKTLSNLVYHDEETGLFVNFTFRKKAKSEDYFLNALTRGKELVAFRFEHILDGMVKVHSNGKHKVNTEIAFIYLNAFKNVKHVYFHGELSQAGIKKEYERGGIYYISLDYRGIFTKTVKWVTDYKNFNKKISAIRNLQSEMFDETYLIHQKVDIEEVEFNNYPKDIFETFKSGTIQVRMQMERLDMFDAKFELKRVDKNNEPNMTLKFENIEELISEISFYMKQFEIEEFIGEKDFESMFRQMIDMPISEKRKVFDELLRVTKKNDSVLSTELLRVTDGIFKGYRFRFEAKLTTPDRATNHKLESFCYNVPLFNEEYQVYVIFDDKTSEEIFVGVTLSDDKEAEDKMIRDIKILLFDMIY